MYRYEALTAKTKCLMGRLLSEDELTYLSGMKTVGEIAVFLRDKTAYGETLREINLVQANRRKLEYYIKKTVFADYLKMRRFTHGEEREYIALLLVKYEIEYMLNAWRYCIARAKMSEDEKKLWDESDNYRPSEGILELYTIYGQKSKLDLGELRDAETVRDFLRAISGTEYQRIFASGEGGDYAEIEHEIYAGYYKKLMAAAEAFGAEGESLKTVLTAAVDMKNLELIYRMRYNFGMTAAETAKRVIPYRYKLKKTDISDLLNAGDPQKYLARCNATYYGRKADFTEAPVFAVGAAYLYRLYKSTALKNSSSFDVIVKYFYLKETEIDNLVFIIEGARYGMRPEEIKSNLIM